MNIQQLRKELDLYGHDIDSVKSIQLHEDILEIINEFYANVFDEVKKTASAQFVKMETAINNLKEHRDQQQESIRALTYDQQVKLEQLRDLQAEVKRLRLQNQSYTPPYNPPSLPTIDNPYPRVPNVWTSGHAELLQNAQHRGDVDLTNNLSSYKATCEEFEDEDAQEEEEVVDEETAGGLRKYIEEKFDNLFSK